MSIFSNKKVITAIGVSVITVVGLAALGMRKLTKQLEIAFSESNDSTEAAEQELTVSDIINADPVKNPSATQVK